MNSIRKRLRSNQKLRALYESALHKGLIPGRKFIPWQLTRNNSAEKWALIEAAISGSGATSLLDVGCDAGQVTRLAAASGLFAVGVDQNTSFLKVEDPTKGACFGNVLLTDDIIETLPNFSVILLLSVHHQIVKSQGDVEAKRVVQKLFAKATHALFVEHTALTERFGYNPPRFTDNDEASVRAYAIKWLGDALDGASPRYVGKVKESKEEPFRFMYMISKDR